LGEMVTVWGVGEMVTVWGVGGDGYCVGIWGRRV